MSKKINIKNSQDQTLLFYAIREGYLSIIRKLLTNKNIDINISNHQKRTPLHEVAWTMNVEAFKLLIAHKNIQVNAQDEEGFTPLHDLLFCRGKDYVNPKRFKEIFFGLIGHKDIKIDLETNDKKTPLSYAVHNQKAKYVTKLLSRGADPRKVNNDSMEYVDKSIKTLLVQEINKNKENKK